MESNSDKARELASKEEEKSSIAKVTSGNVSVEKSSFRKFMDAFFPTDFSTLREHAIHDILIPMGKDALEDLLHLALRKEPLSIRRRSTSGGRTNYNQPYTLRERDRDRDRTRSSYQLSEEDAPNLVSKRYEDLIFDNRGDAELVLETALDTIEEYQVCSVRTFYEFAGAPISAVIFNRMGWKNLDNAHIERCQYGYKLCMPKPMIFD